MSDSPPQPPRRIQRQINTLGHGLLRLRDAIEVLKRRVARGNVGDEMLRAWLQPWLAMTVIELPADSAASAMLAWDEESWRVLSPCGAEITTAWAAALMLLHLPALRSFWKIAMRASRLRRLQRVLPKAWPMDTATLPAGAVIAGLGITGWAQLPQKLETGLKYRALSTTNEVIEFSSDQTSQLNGLLKRITTEPWLLVAVSSVHDDEHALQASWTRNDSGRVVISQTPDDQALR